MVRPPLSVLLSFNAGYVDTMGFLALAGLFTAHVTGNFVTVGAALVFGTTGVVAKLLALPLFCLIVALTRLLGLFLQRSEASTIHILTSLMLTLFVITTVFAFLHGPFENANGAASICMGMILVSAMAVQNTLHRAYLPKLPPTTLMTGTTTQIMLDLADLAAGRAGERRAAILHRLKRMGSSLGGFALGCAMGALFFTVSETWCFIVPPLLIALSFVAHNEQLDEA